MAFAIWASAILKCNNWALLGWDRAPFWFLSPFLTIFLTLKVFLGSYLTNLDFALFCQTLFSGSSFTTLLLLRRSETFFLDFLMMSFLALFLLCLTFVLLPPFLIFLVSRKCSKRLETVVSSLFFWPREEVSSSGTEVAVSPSSSTEMSLCSSITTILFSRESCSVAVSAKTSLVCWWPVVRSVSKKVESYCNVQWIPWNT